MTVKELIEELKKYDENLRVEGMWEGITVEVSEVSLEDHRYGGKFVMLNVDK